MKILIDFLIDLGKYLLLMSKVFRKPQKFSVFYLRFIKDINLLVLDSLGIVLIISIFTGAVLTLQTAYNIDNPFIPKYVIGYTTRETIFLEFSPTIISLILAGKVGSIIASEIGSLRISEQITALEIMGVNSANYLILPKILACVLFNPILIILSMFIGNIGGWLAGVVFAKIVSHADFMDGIFTDFKPYVIFYSMVKTMVFALIITSISGFYGYFTKGSALEVGRSSTKAVVVSSVVIIIFNLLLTELLLS